MDPGDHRLGHAGEGDHHAAAFLEQGLVAALIRRLAHLLKVVTGGEGTAVGGQDQQTHAIVLGDRVERVLQRVEQAVGQGVVLLRSIEGEGADAVGDLAKQRGIVGLGRVAVGFHGMVNPRIVGVSDLRAGKPGANLGKRQEPIVSMVTNC